MMAIWPIVVLASREAWSERWELHVHPPDAHTQRVKTREVTRTSDKNKYSYLTHSYLTYNRVRVALYTRTV